MAKSFKKEKQLYIWNKYGRRCAYCGDKLEYKKMQVDHIVPQYNFFKWYHQFELNGYNHGIPEFLLHLTPADVNHSDNLNPACAKCNKYKSSFGLEEFRIQIQSQVERLNKYITQYYRAKKFGLVVETGKKVVFYFEKINKHV
jgi:5-methylcytosine-specific restriction endonuclease McrA